MNLSMQIGRGLIALTLSLALGAYAATRESTDAQVDVCQTNIAHGRLAIVDLHDNGETPHWFVASVRVGDPVPVQAAHARQVVSHIHAKDGQG